MSSTDYLNIIFSGYFKNPNLLKEYLIRHQKKCEIDDFVTIIEFYDNCTQVVYKLKEMVLSKYLERKKELAEVLDFKESKGLDTTDTKKQFESLSKNDNSIPLIHLTNDEFRQHLYYSDIIFIESVINSLNPNSQSNLEAEEIYGLEDYYKHYEKTKRFGFGFLKSFEKNQFLEIRNKLTLFKIQFLYIYNRLPVNDKLEFKYDFLDQLKSLQKIQKLTKFKKLILELINTLEQPQETENKKLDEDTKELHSAIFKDNYFKVWQKMFDAFQIKESSYNTDLDFMYNVMYDKGFINKNVGKKDMLDWINDIYQITFTKIRYTNYKGNSNKSRLIIFNEILENIKGTKHN